MSDITIPNFRTVVPGLVWRGGQPQPTDWPALYDLGVRQVIKLNPAGEDGTPDDGPLPPSVALFRVPMSLGEQVLPIWEHKKLCNDAACAAEFTAYQGVRSYVHCEHGQDRTSLVIGLWRRSQGVSKADAWAEMLACGFHVELLGLVAAWEALA